MDAILVFPEAVIDHMLSCSTRAIPESTHVPCRLANVADDVQDGVGPGEVATAGVPAVNHQAVLNAARNDTARFGTWPICPKLRYS